MQRSAGVVEDVVGREVEAPESQYRQMIEVQEYATEPKNPATSQCSSAGCT